MIVRWFKRLDAWNRSFVVFGGFALTLVIVVVGLLYWHNNRVETMIARIRAAGEPVTVAELDALLPAIPPDRDATRLWLDGFDVNGPADQERYGKLPFVGAKTSDEPPFPGSHWPELALAEEYLADHAKALELFHEAAELGGAARLQPIDDPDSFDFESPKQATRLLLVESLVHAHKGRVGPTVASLRAALAFGKAFGGRPSQMSFLVRQAIYERATVQLLRLLPHVPFSDAELARLQSILRAIDHRRENLDAQLGERVLGIRALRDSAPIDGPDLDGDQTFLLALMGELSIPDYLETMGEAVAAAKLRWPEALEKANQIKNREDTNPFSMLLAVYGTWMIDPVFRAAARATARTRLADLAIAAQRYRLANGRLPMAIDDLAPAFLPSIPLDPFTGEPLYYAPTDDGFVVYSVGEDRKDDGGLIDEFQTYEPDLGYRIRYPKDGGDAAIE